MAGPAVTVVLDVWMVSVADLLHHRIEAVVLVRCVVDDALGAIGLGQTVGALDRVTVTRLPGFFLVTGVRVFDGVTEFVVGRGLRMARRRRISVYSVGENLFRSVRGEDLRDSRGVHRPSRGRGRRRCRARDRGAGRRERSCARGKRPRRRTLGPSYTKQSAGE